MAKSKVLGKRMLRPIVSGVTVALIFQLGSLPGFCRGDEDDFKPSRRLETLPKNTNRVDKSYVNDEPPLDIEKSDPAVHVRLSKKYTAQKRYKEALIEVNRALICNKDDWEARYQGALIFQLQGRTDEAIQRYRQFLRVKPDHLQAHIHLGVLLRQKGEFEEAEDEYKKAIEIKFYSLEAHYNLANLYI
jgi:Flp pilus assembly protein TadD